MWDTRLNAYSEANGKVTGVRCLVEAADVIRTKFGNPVLPDGGWYWKVVSGMFMGEQQGLHQIAVSVVDENGAPVPCQVWHAYPSDNMGQADWSKAFDAGGGPGLVFSYPTGSGNIAMGTNNFSPKVGSTTPMGPYMVAVFTPAEQGGIIASEIVWGMGMPYNHHVSFAFTFQRTKKGTGGSTPGAPGCNLAAAITAFFEALKKA